MARRPISLLVAAACAAMLSSCSLLPPHPVPLVDDSDQKADGQMRLIADAVKDHDASALKKLFSSRARERATDLESGLDYFLSVFPSGKMNWQSQGTGLKEETGSSRRVTELYGGYKVFANNKKYDLYFVLVSVNDYDSRDVGIYALGVAPWTKNALTASGGKQPFDVWASQFGISESDHVADGTAGVYIPQ